MILNSSELSSEVCKRLLHHIYENCRDLVKVLRFFVKIGATSVIDKIAHASSVEELRRILTEEVTRLLESIRRGATVENNKVIYKEPVRDTHEEAYFRSIGVEIKEEEGRKVIIVEVPRDPRPEELVFVESAATVCSVRDVATVLALLARSRVG